MLVCVRARGAFQKKKRACVVKLLAEVARVKVPAGTIPAEYKLVVGALARRDRAPARAGLLRCRVCTAQPWTAGRMQRWLGCDARKEWAGVGVSTALNPCQQSLSAAGIVVRFQVELMDDLYLSRCRYFSLHQSRGVSLAEQCSPPGDPCLTLLRLIKSQVNWNHAAVVIPGTRRRVCPPRPMVRSSFRDP